MANNRDDWIPWHEYEEPDRPFLYTDEEERYGVIVCNRCKYVDLPILQKMEAGMHYAKVICRGCLRYVRWAPRPQEED